ncbi:hypothetical protein BU16DRAFT_579783 [Lophium mytilinum]|uniref:Heterokaryon incompatibility domain-containing protein n=1 Tax=Lophium mytilinum TaxID=390894 RepID=A0A6A6R2X3_9PEZI|nr:hypothetical protein BU16DRAFT_579783 [Lophium mytilinum]
MPRRDQKTTSESEESEEELNEYKYSDLEKPNSIRLLKLKPGGRKSGEVVCDLVEEDLDWHDAEKADKSKNKKTEYEALSWNWGTLPWDQKIRVSHKGEDYYQLVPPSLAAALKALRDRRNVRVLWVDAICMNQKNTNEKNRQVPMMSKIYGCASSVCVWIGEVDKDSKIALDFIKDEVLRLERFDELCEDPTSSHKWGAMLNLMKRPCFSRRWVVQEIALANEAAIYCGNDSIPWKDFSDAVQLFVEVETATHRLSEVMKMDPKFYHVPGWFEYVSALGASLLVDATGTLFRVSKRQKRQPLLSLEYLVSTLSVFQATEPRDTIYSLLAIAKDTAPVAVIHGNTASSATPAKAQLNAWAYRNMKAKPYKVDHSLPFIAICKEFILFSIRQSENKTQALDVICRPKPDDVPGKVEDDQAMPSWIPKLFGAAYAMYTHPNGELKMGRQNADPLVGLPSLSHRNYSAAENREVDLDVLRFRKREGHFSMYVLGFGGWEDIEDDPPQEFWRTLVADRGRLGRNPPTYYARACKESVTKGLTSGSLNTTELINDGRCSVVAEFFRGVQAVIWNRSLMRTKSSDLGIVHEDAKEGDLICILYGCSVPVVLRRFEKTAEEMAKEQAEDEEELARQREIAATKIQRGFRESRKRKRDPLEDMGRTTEMPVPHMNGSAPKAAAGPKTAPPLKPKPSSKPVQQKRKKDDDESKQKDKARGVYYQLTGECYVHGYMDGKAIKYQNDHDIKAEVFEMR